MKSWTRIIIAVFILIGGTASFGYWSMGQFDNALNNLSSYYVASVLLAPALSKTSNEQVSTTSPAVATSTESGLVGTSATSTGSKLVETIATSTKPDLSFIFPQKNTEVYVGCTYKISWNSSLKISSLETTLIDGGTKEAVGPIASGLAKESTIGKDSQNLDWRVGVIWPGSYYFKISKINGIDTEIRSNSFMINKMPNKLGVEDQKKLCEKTGGLFK